MLEQMQAVGKDDWNCFSHIIYIKTYNPAYCSDSVSQVAPISLLNFIVFTVYRAFYYTLHKSAFGPLEKAEGKSGEEKLLKMSWDLKRSRHFIIDTT